MEHGVVRDWSDMERVWSSVYGPEMLNTTSEAHSVSYTLWFVLSFNFFCLFLLLFHIKKFSCVYCIHLHIGFVN